MRMDAEEKDIYYYLKSRREDYVAVREISQRVGSKRRRQFSPEWAQPFLERMLARGIVEFDGTEGFRLKPMPRPDTTGKRWTSPAMAKILKASGKSFDQVLTSEEEDEYYDRL